LLAVTLAALAVGGVAQLSGAVGVAELCWAAGAVAALGPSVVWVVAALRRGRVGVDVLAVLSP